MTRKRIKILYTIPNFDTAGSGKVVFDLVKHLERDRFELHICCFHNKGVLFKEVEQLDVSIHLFDFAIRYRPFLTFPFRLLKVIRFFKKHQFDLIHSWHWSSDFSEPLAARLAGIPWIYTKKNMGWGNKAWKWRSTLSKNIIIVNSDMSRFFDSARLKAKLKSIPFGVDTEYYKSGIIDHNEILNNLNFRGDEFIIVSVANLSPIKGLEYLINAVIELNHPKIRLLLIGDDKGVYAQSLKELARDTLKIQFLGKKIDVRPYHSIADLFVISTLHKGEGLPVAPIEAMSSGCVVIGSEVPGIKDILNKFSRHLFKPSSVESLKNRILEMKELSEGKQEKLQKEMRNEVERRYSLSGFIGQHEELYTGIIK